MHHPRIISVKFHWNLLSGFRGEDFLSNCSRADGHTDGCWTMIDHNSSPWARRAQVSLKGRWPDGWQKTLVKEEMVHLGLVLHISLLAPGNGQMSVKDISFTKKIASHRVHVEHVISRANKIAIMALERSCESSPQNEFYLLCSYYSNLWPPGWSQFRPPWHHMNKLGRGPQENAAYQISKL